MEGALLNYDVILSSYFIEPSAVRLFSFCFLIHVQE